MGVRTELLRALLAAGLLLASSAPAQAQPAPTSAPAPASQAAGSSQAGRQALGGHTVPRLAGAAPVGQTDPTRRLQLSIGLQPSNPQQLASLLQQQRDPHSPLFRSHLPPGQFTAQFGPPQSAVDAVSAYLRGQGLQVTGVAPNRLLIFAQGSVKDVEQAFQVQLRDFVVDGRPVYAPISDPSLPTSVASLVRSIQGLEDVTQLRPHLARPTQRAHAGSGPGGGYVPDELRTAYDLSPLPGGAGQSVALVEFDGYDPNDVTTFARTYGGGSLSLTTHLVDGASASPGPDALEDELDIEVVAGLAPSAAQHVYIAPNTSQGAVDVLNQIVSDDLAPVISTSWGLCEQLTPAAELQQTETILSQAAAQGQAFFASAGDSGAYDCDGLDGDPLAVDFPASDPSATGVGGTSLATGSGGAYAGESVWSCPASQCGGADGTGGGGGLSVEFSQPAYQTGPGVANSSSNGMREVPDVSADADPNTGYAVYCTVADASCPGSGWLEVGGTSGAAPLWAALATDVNAYLASLGKPPLGSAHAELYELFNTGQPLPAYHDVTSGNNLHYPATAGFDLASGIGSPDGWNLARDVAETATTPDLVLLPQPQRLVDTRGGAEPAAGSSPCFTVAGVDGIPSSAAGVILNVTSTGATSSGWLTLFPAGQPVPATSTLDFDKNASAIANNAIVRLGSGGQVCVNVGRSASQIVLDAVGYLAAGASQVQLLPQAQRLVDTRSSAQPAAGTSPCFSLAGNGGIPATAAGLLLNVTATGYSGSGWLTVFPAGQPLPATSTLNFDTNAFAIANGAIVRPGTGGQVCVNIGQSAAQVIIDAVGYLASSSGQVQLLPAPQRLVDTRSGSEPTAGASPCFTLAGQGGIPASAAGVLVNLTSTGYTGSGWLSLFPAGQSVPATSTLNFDPRAHAIANGAIARLGANGQVCVNVGRSAAQVILDAMGYLVD